MTKRKIRLEKILNTKIIRIFVHILFFSAIICTIINTWYLISEPFNITHNIKHNNIDQYTIDFLTESSYSELGLININDIEKTINTIGSQETIAYNYAEIISIEFQLIIIILILYEIINFITEKNLEKPFTSKSIKYINNIIKYLTYLIFIPIFIYLIECLIIPSYIEVIGDIFPYIYQIISLENIIYIMIFFIIKYILIKGKELKNTTSSK